MTSAKRILALNLALLLAFLLALPALAAAASSISLGQSVTCPLGDSFSFTPPADGVYRVVITENDGMTPASLRLYKDGQSLGGISSSYLCTLKGRVTYVFRAVCDARPVGSHPPTFHIESFHDTVSTPYRGEIDLKTDLYLWPSEDGYYDISLHIPEGIAYQQARLSIYTAISGKEAAGMSKGNQSAVEVKTGEPNSTDQGNVRTYTRWLSQENLYRISMPNSYPNGTPGTPYYGYTRSYVSFRDTDKFPITIEPSDGPPALPTSELDGGTWSGTWVLNADGTLQKPVDPTKPSYFFAGWYLDDGTVWDFSRRATTGLKLNARWLPAVKIILRLDTGDVPIEAGQGAPMNVPTNPTKEGYTFAGWFTDEALTIPWNFNTPVAGDMSLYGKWAPLSSTATGTGRSSQAITFNGAPIQLEAYTLAADDNGGDVTFVKLRDVAQVLDGSEDQFNVDWKNGAIYIAGKSPYTSKNGTELQPIVVNTTAYAQNTSPVLFDGQMKQLESIVITDINGGGHSFFKLRDLADAIGFTVDWTAEKGIYIESE